MIRQQKRFKSRQEKAVQKIVTEFLVLYNKDILKAQQLVQAKNRKSEISNVNDHFLQVWRGILAHVKQYFAAVHLDRNYFSTKMIWE